MYFNKKYKRSGSLFAGPYKVASLKGGDEILLLTHHIHNLGVFSSLPEYTGERVTSWVKPILAGKSEKDYGEYVQKHKLTNEEKVILETVIIDKTNPGESTLERSVLTSDHQKGEPRVFEYSIITVIFITLLGFGLKNIKSIEASSPQTSVLSESTSADPTPAAIPATYVIIKITDSSETINIRSGPSIQAEKVGQATEGQVFESVDSSSLDWFGIKLPDGAVGYVYKSYAQIK